MSRGHSEAVHLEKHTPNLSAAPTHPAPPPPPLFLLFDILSKGLNNNQTAQQLLWVMNSTGFENDLEEENGNTHSFEPFHRKHPPPPKE